MKYCLRSASADQQTNELSNAISEIQYTRKKYKIKKNNRNNHKTKKVNKKSAKTKTKSTLRSKSKPDPTKMRKQTPIYDKILRFPMKYQKKTIRLYCYKQSDLEMKKRFCGGLIQHKMDDDQQSRDSLIEAQLQRCNQFLFSSIRKNSQAKSATNISTPVKQEYKSDINFEDQTTPRINKLKPRNKISKRPKSKKK